MKLSKLGEDDTETLEVIPRQWKVVQTVREKFTCRACEAITQPPAPFHVTPRGFVGPNLLAMVLFEKFGQHQPLNRQSERYGREGIDLSVSTLADQVGASTNDVLLWRDEAQMLNLAGFGASEHRLLSQAGFEGLEDILEVDLETFRTRLARGADELKLEPPSDLTSEGWWDQAHTLAE